MGTKLLIKETGELIDLARGSSIPREGEALILTLRGTKEEKLYQIYLVEHKIDFNNQLPITQTVITIEEQAVPVDVEQEPETEEPEVQV